MDILKGLQKKSFILNESFLMNEFFNMNPEIAEFFSYSHNCNEKKNLRRELRLEKKNVFFPSKKKKDSLGIKDNKDDADNDDDNNK